MAVPRTRSVATCPDPGAVGDVGSSEVSCRSRGTLREDLGGKIGRGPSATTEKSRGIVSRLKRYGGSEMDPEAIVFGVVTGVGEWALCVDEHGHGLFIPEAALEELVTPEARAMLTADRETAQRFLGDPLAAFCGMLATRG